MAVLGLSLSLGLAGTLALYKYEDVEVAESDTMNVDILLVQDDVTIGGLKYTVQPTEENTDYIYTRLIIYPIIEIQESVGSDKYNAYAGIPSSNINYTVTGNDWKEYDGYFYYQKQIDSGINSARNLTSQISIEEVTIDTTSYDNGSGEWFDLPTEVDGRGIRVRFYVSAEAVQASNNAYQLSWDLTENEFVNSVGIQDLNKAPQAD